MIQVKNIRAFSKAVTVRRKNRIGDFFDMLN